MLAVQHSRSAPRRRPPPSRPPTLIESDYAARLVAIVGRIRAATNHALTTWTWMHRADAARVDDHPGAEARHKAEQIRSAVEGGLDVDALEHTVGEFGRRVSEHQRGDFARQAKVALGVEPHIPDRGVPDAIAGFIHENVSLIRRMQGETLGQIETLLTRAVASGTRAHAVADEIAARFDVSERHARLIARDQIGKVNSQITTARHQALGITGYFWQHIANPHPRVEHIARNGKRFAYADPPADGNPGMAICCHCLALPDFSDLTA